MARFQRQRAIVTMAFFVAGLGFVFAFDYPGNGNMVLKPDAPVFILVGIALAALIYVLLQRVIPSSRPCPGCGEPVPLGASTCPSCGTSVGRTRPPKASSKGLLPPRS